MKSILLSGAVAALIAGPALADDTADAIAQLRQEMEALKAKNERLEATVEYLKANASAEHKDSATQAAAVDTLKTTVAKFSWSGDFRYRHEIIDAEDEVTGRTRDRVRLRFGVLAKVNDTVNARIQLSTTNTGNDGPRSTNQTLGSGWDRKPLSIDLAYVEWKASNMLNLQLGKMPIPWTTTASYFWDKDLTPEGAALKFARGPVFAGVYYDWLNERHSGSSKSASSDANMVGAQLGLKQAIGASTLTVAAAYFDLNQVKDWPVWTTASGTTINGVATTAACAADGAFGAGQGSSVSRNSFGNTVYVGSNCVRLLSDFNLIEGLAQFDTKIGRFPLVVFADYMKNNAASTADTAFSAGVTFNKASAAKSWELSYIYQKSDADGIFGQFHDSDFGGGRTNSKGSVVKVGYVPATNWTLNGTYFINTRVIQDGAQTINSGASLDYKRLQLDLNFKF